MMRPLGVAADARRRGNTVEAMGHRWRMRALTTKLKLKPPTQPRLKLLTREKAETPNFLITKKKSKKLEIF